MPKVDKIEYEKRIRLIQEWILEDWPSCDIITQVTVKWPVGERQAKRDIAEARKRWVSDDTAVTDHKRRLKVESLKKIKRSLLEKHKGTPAGIRALVAVEKEIISLEGLRKPVKVELTGKDGQPIQTENTSVVLYLPDNGRDAKKGD
jgi:hypothetical protein